MKPSERVRRHGYHLMSLASVGQLVCFIGWIATLGASWNLLTGKPPGTDPDNTEFWLTAAMASIALLGKLWALYRLRVIGKFLYGGSFISHDMAHAWRWLGHALVIAGVLGVVSLNPGIDLYLDGAAYELTAGVDFGQTYFILMACLTSYSIAWILDEAVALKDDNQGIV